MLYYLLTDEKNMINCYGGKTQDYLKIN